MRIAIWHNLPSGGGKRALYDHVRGLLERGHEVEAWAPSSLNRSYLPLETLIEQHVLLLREEGYGPFEQLQLRLHIHGRLSAMEAHARECAEQIRAGGFDVLLANSCMYFHTPMIGRFVDIPTLLYLQEPCRWLTEAMPDPFWAAPPSEGRTLKSRFVDLRNQRNARVQLREEVRNAKAYGRILCNSYFSRESILRTYGVAAEVCYLGVDEQLFTLGTEEREKFVIGLGALGPHKNPALCIEAIGRMRAPRPMLVWIGNVADPVYCDELIALAAARGVELELKVNIPDEALFDYLRRATAMIYSPRLEPFGLAPLEANACGTPVVAVAEGGVRETIADGVNGLLGDADPDSLAAALQRLFDDPALARRLGGQGRRLVETKWSHGAAADRLVAKLEAEIARHHA